MTQPSNFQQEILALSFEDFVEKTNIKELVEGDFDKQFNGQKEITPVAMDFGLREYYRLRSNHEKWHINSLKNLRFKQCDCKRMKTFNDGTTQTNDVEVQDEEIQCRPLDFNGNETTESQSQSSQTNVALLTVHTVSDSQIISMYDSQSPDSQSQHEHGANTTGN